MPPHPSNPPHNGPRAGTGRTSESEITDQNPSQTRQAVCLTAMARQTVVKRTSGQTGQWSNWPVVKRASCEIGQWSNSAHRQTELVVKRASGQTGPVWSNGASGQRSQRWGTSKRRGVTMTSRYVTLTRRSHLSVMCPPYMISPKMYLTHTQILVKHTGQTRPRSPPERAVAGRMRHVQDKVVKRSPGRILLCGQMIKR